MIRRDFGARHGLAWVLLTLALAAHVIDEALNDFLSFYNPAVQAIRQAVPFLPLPTFTYESWLSVLILAVVVLAAITPLVVRGGRWTIFLSYFFSFFMILNGLGHIAVSFYLRRPMPGVYSSPLLLAAAAFLFHATRQRSAVKT
ncbi:MAG: HXXEE domain-containing protein [Vicinamibacteria bacterium]